ncbi:MAG: hypothetical protein D8M52_08400 [Chlorobi bacterium]|nr:MAG: hypothetical protein F9K28_05650 [Bacteroidota bacterium]KXK35070.1 MAG: hypothetical protein UZ06_CHB003000742 [Chlorobi bacterium OLB6]MBE2265578.1 hypothetical protein [Flavobacteriales bacterium]MBL1161722.1 hypothetical protein [Chlorobiota bacterium]MBW7853916.1 hypothetical protein [Candidatus Kapabacteria bacterium]MCC6331793.1 hypothetical protein [Ignavibacteria bacterium]
MSRVLFRVSYTIPDGKRSEYLMLVRKLHSFYAANAVDYSVFEDNTKHNHFQETYIYPSIEAYEASDDPDNTREIADVLDAVYSMADNVVYNVAKEVTW